MIAERTGEELALLELADFADDSAIHYFGIVVVAQSGPRASQVARLFSSACDENERLFQNIAVSLEQAIGLNSLSDGRHARTHQIQGHNIQTCLLQQVYDRRIGFLWMFDRRERPPVTREKLEEIGRRIEQRIRDQKLLSIYPAIRKYESNQDAERNPFKLLGQFISEAIGNSFVAIWENISERELENYKGYKTVFTTDNQDRFIMKGTGLVGYCFETGKRFRVEDIADDNSIRKIFGRSIANQAFRDAKGLRAAIYHPIIFENAVQAVIGIFFNRPYGATNVELEILKAVLAIFRPELRYRNDRDHAYKIRKRYGKYSPKLKLALSVAQTIHKFKDDTVALRSKLSGLVVRPSQEDDLKQARFLAKRIADSAAATKDAMTSSEQEGGFFKTMRFHRFNLRDQIDVSVKKFDQIAIAQGISIKVNIRPDLVLNSRSDLIEDIIDNAISNAVKSLMFTRGRKRSITISATRNDLIAQIKIRDTGSGVEAELHNSIFEPFFTTNQKDSLGLGLAIVRSAAEELGGVAKVESEWGSSFELQVEFPVGD